MNAVNSKNAPIIRKQMKYKTDVISGKYSEALNNSTQYSINVNFSLKFLPHFCLFCVELLPAYEFVISTFPLYTSPNSTPTTRLFVSFATLV